MSIETHDVDEKMTISALHKKEDIIIPVNESEYWDDEIFTVSMIVINVETVSTSFNSIKMNLSCEDMVSNSIEIPLKDYKNDKIKI